MSSQKQQIKVVRNAVLQLLKVRDGLAHPRVRERNQKKPVLAWRLPEQPFDQELLLSSRLYPRSRQLFMECGGSWTPALLSSPRSLSSPGLLRSRIEYSPIESELIWLATDPRQKGRRERLLELRTFSTSLFHEQNHRVLWNVLARAPDEKGACRRYLNFAESLVIALDMALGDELGTYWSQMCYQLGIAYDPGTTVREELTGARDYRNYLQSCLHATYMRLEGYSKRDIQKCVRYLFPNLGEFAERAARRSWNLDPLFVQVTNPVWQRRNYETVVKELGRGGGSIGAFTEPLALPEDPLQNYKAYCVAEKVFESYGL